MSSEFRGLIRGVFWVLALAAIVPTQADPDLWGNLRFGRDLLETWSLSTTDLYSFTQDKPWINHSWLPQLVLAAAYNTAGPAGIVLVKVLLLAAILWLIAGAFRGAGTLVAEAAVAVVVIVGLPVFATARAQLWTFLGVVVLCRLMLSSRPRVMLWSPLLFAVWVNAHVGWLIGLAMLAWWAIGMWVRGSTSDRGWAAAVVAISMLATLVNPYGSQMWQFLFGVAHLTRNIMEWEPLTSAPLINRAAVIAAVVAVIGFRSRLPFERVVIVIGLAYAAFRAMKFDSLCIAATVLFLSPIVVNRFPRVMGATTPPSLGVRVINGVAAAIVLAFAAVNAWPKLACLPSADWRPDPSAAAALHGANPSGRMVVTFDWGEYVIWHHGPRLRVSFDPRFDLVYSPATIAEQTAVGGAEPQGVEFLKRSQPEFVWFRQSDVALKKWLAANGYRLDVETPASFIAVRQDLPVVNGAGSQAPGCFPAP